MASRIPRRRSPQESNPQGRQGETLPAQGPNQERAPRMPHERDESADSQRADEPSADRMGDIAHDDVARGLVDTDKGPVLDKTYDKLTGDDEREHVKKFRP